MTSGVSTDLLVVVGARPNFMKAAPVVEAARRAGLSTALLHTGQHYDVALSRVFFEDLALPEPDVYLGIGSGSHAAQTAGIMLAFEAELLRIRPSIVVVVGDVNSTLACALVAVKEHFAVAHVEAGLRSWDAAMPEEINRRLTDHISTYLFTTSPDAGENLAAEGVAPERIRFVGNPMIDTLLRFRGAAERRGVPARLGLDPGKYAVVTLHRPENVDDSGRLAAIVDALVELARNVQIVFPIHPRTRARLDVAGAGERLASAGIRCLDPLGYLDFLSLELSAGAVLTDSGGIQEETSALGVACYTLRANTERPITLSQGTNTLLGSDPSAIPAIRPTPATELPPIPLWDGHAGERIAAVLMLVLNEQKGSAQLSVPALARGSRGVRSSSGVRLTVCGWTRLSNGAARRSRKGASYSTWPSMLRRSSQSGQILVSRRLFQTPSWLRRTDNRSSGPPDSCVTRCPNASAGSTSWRNSSHSPRTEATAFTFSGRRMRRWLVRWSVCWSATRASYSPAHIMGTSQTRNLRCSAIQSGQASQTSF